MPALDAVFFLTPRNSQVDVVLSIGRVMRRTPDGKKATRLQTAIRTSEGRCPSWLRGLFVRVSDSVEAWNKPFNGPTMSSARIGS